jgi:hypothetical protein
MWESERMPPSAIAFARTAPASYTLKLFHREFAKRLFSATIHPNRSIR